MTVTDPIADMLTRIRNGLMASHQAVEVPSSKLKVELAKLLKEEGLRDDVKVIIGGAPVSQDFADEIVADGFAPDAASAADLCKKLLGIA